MRSLELVTLSKNEKSALKELVSTVKNQFPIQKVILFGSRARNQGDPESDIDLLFLSKGKLSYKKYHEISDIICEINLKYMVNFSFICVPLHEWDNGVYPLMPIYRNVQREGVVL